jgi:guanyl-specific ribonuclease Sa
MNKKHLRLWLLLMCVILTLGLFAGCRKKSTSKETTKKTTTVTETTAAPETTDAPSEETSSETELTSPSRSSTESEKETSEEPSESTTEATESTEEFVEFTTEESTKKTKKTKATKSTTEATEAPSEDPTEAPIDENGTYTSKDDVALYIHTYGHLPSNFVTKSEARKKGWEGGSLEDYFPGCSIGGDVFGNREGILPTKKGRTYYECDIDTKGKKSRGAKRIVFSNDGLIYYTDDHYETFTLLYGEE